MEAKLQTALKRIQELEEENKKLRERIFAFEEECELRDEDESLLYDKNQRLKTENKKLKAEIIKLKAEKIEIEKNWEDEGEQSGNIIYELKNEVKELKKRMDNLEKNIENDTVYPEAETENEAEWYDLKVDHDYEIRNIFPYDIKRKSDGKIIGECINKKSGYV